LWGAGGEAGGGAGRPQKRGHAGPRGATPTPVARGRGEQYRVHGAADRAVPGTPRALGAPVPGAGPPPPDTARGDVRGGDGLELLHASYAFVPRTEDDAGHGGR